MQRSTFVTRAAHQNHRMCVYKQVNFSAKDWDRSKGAAPHNTALRNTTQHSITRNAAIICICAQSSQRSIVVFCSWPSVVAAVAQQRQQPQRCCGCGVAVVAVAATDANDNDDDDAGHLFVARVVRANGCDRRSGCGDRMRGNVAIVTVVSSLWTRELFVRLLKRCVDGAL